MTSKSKPAKTKNTIIVRPGREALQGFLRTNSKLFNVSELERIAGLSGSTLRHICAGSREMQQDEYNRLKSSMLPKLCECVLFLQNYD